jgi:L-asparaginase
MQAGTSNKSKILLIYTGGTIGMIEDNTSGSYLPFSIESILGFVPKLKELDADISVVSFDTPLDSAHVGLNEWLEIKTIIQKNYEAYEGFVVLHGTDTMAFSASALGFLLQGLNKPVIFTGSQLPISKPRSDAHENLVTAIEIAIAQKNNKPRVPEVTLFFDNNLYRGVRSTKNNAEDFDAFSSANYSVLATAGVNIKFKDAQIKKISDNAFQALNELEENVVILKLFPGINDAYIKQVVSASWVKGIVLETFGTGTVNLSDESVEVLKKAINGGVKIIAVSQCNVGSVELGKYEASSVLKEIGVLSGKDITSEAALTKMMVVLGNYTDATKIDALLTANWVGELTAN